MTTSGVCLQRLQDRVGLLPKGLQAHIYRVRDIAFELSSRHHVDIQRTELAVLGHDVARALKGEELLRRAVAAGMRRGSWNAAPRSCSTARLAQRASDGKTI